MKQDELVFLPLGGSGEIGMNFNAYGFGRADDRQWIIVDCGVLFGRETTTPGVDVIMPDIRYLAERRDNILGIIATHGHEDHIGAIAYLWPTLRCPVFATPFTAKLVKGKLEEAGLTGKAKITSVPLSGEFALGPFGIRFVSITHSIPEPNALAIKTPLGTILHTGDWKLDPAPLVGEATDGEAFRKLGDDGVLALVCDSTNALVDGHSGSESDVRPSLIELVKAQKGRVAVTAFASNVARLETVGAAARATGRHLVLVGRAMHKITAAARETGYLDNFPDTLDEEDAANLPPHKVLYLCTGSQGEPRAALSRIASGKHPNVKLGKGDAVIFSSRVIPGNDIPIHDLANNLAGLGVTVLTAEDHFVHVSGHPARDELAQMYRWTRPQIAVPVHGELRHMTEHARLAKSLQVPQALVPRNGRMFRLAPGDAELIDEVPSGRVHLDGRVLVAEGEGLTRDRRALAFAGIIAITLVLDERGRIAAEAGIITDGMPEPVDAAICDAVDETLRRHNPKKSNEDQLKDTVRRAARRAAEDAWGKKPVTRVTIVTL